MMKQTLALAIALTLSAGVAAAQTGADRNERPARIHKLDANGDGVIDRSEAAAFPRLAGRFDQLDANSDGKLEAGEMPRHGRRGHQGHRGHHGPRAKGHHARNGRGMGGIERLDGDGDGRISRAEFDSGQAKQAERRAAVEKRMAERGRAAGKRQLPQAPTFDQLDGNRDGYIVRSELRAWHEQQRPQREAEMRKRFDERFSAADANGDGKLSRAEVEANMPQLARRFAWLDEDRDGLLTKEDLQPRRGR